MFTYLDTSFRTHTLGRTTAVALTDGVMIAFLIFTTICNGKQYWSEVQMSAQEDAASSPLCANSLIRDIITLPINIRQLCDKLNVRNEVD